MSTLTRNIELIQFGCSKRSFCIDVDQVLGVISLPSNLTEAPPVMPFQGENIQIYSLETILEMEEKVRYAPPEIIVLKSDSGHYGITVDWVGEIHRIPFQRSVFRFPHTNVARVKMFGVWGMATLGKNLALILEPASLLSRAQEQEADIPAVPTVKPEAATTVSPSY